MTEHHEAKVELSGSGNEAPPAEPAPDVITLSDTFMENFNAILERTMEQVEELRKQHNIPQEQLPGILNLIGGDFATVYINWSAYKADPEGYLKALEELNAEARREDGNYHLGNV